ncbi:MAG: phosphopantetheine-binding protein, partial [Acidobacteria bacterium]|nr:phosphopantetheine-binding protein [Acidobacteriota bacterium]
YMVPSVYVPLAALPHTPNGKIDRRALPLPDRNDAASKDEWIAPRTPAEARLAEIWGEVLQVGRVGCDDNFFDLGGHSLLGVRLFSQVEQQFGTRLPLATLLEAPTLAQMAGLIGQENWTPSWSSLVPIQREGTRTPFFCTHGAGANVLYLRTLARYLGDDQPFYGLQSQGLDGKTAPFERVEDMAAHYLNELRSVQPQGPYMLGGFSFGGVVVFEMAQQLVAQGEEVSLLALIDTFFPAVPKYLPPRTRFSRFVYPLAGRLDRELSDLGRHGMRQYFRQWWIYVQEGVKRRLARGAKALSPTLAIEGWDISHTLRRVVEANLLAERRYLPRPYPGRVVLFHGSDMPIELQDTRLAWDEVAGGGLEVHIVPGDHNSLREEPHVSVLAAKLRACLDRYLPSAWRPPSRGHFATSKEEAGPIERPTRSFAQAKRARAFFSPLV